MRPIAELLEHVRRIDGRGYGAYKAIRGPYEADGLQLHVDHVQGDPFASPSRLRVIVPTEKAALPEWARRSEAARRAAADFLNRRLAGELRRRSRRRGSGRSGQLRCLEPGQQVLRRSAATVSRDGTVVARFRAGLPAKGRRVLGRQAAEMFAEDVLPSMAAALRFEALDPDALRRHVDVVEDAVALRAALSARSLVGFVADGAVLPRRSGVDDRPLAEGAVPFESPDSLQVTLEAPHAGPVRGMGIPEGVTLIVGGGYHGKSTLLRAIERGVWDHVPGDGREQVVSVADAVKIRAEDGRRIAGTDISNFIGELPGGEDTTRFRTPNASGSTSQAAAIAEALEVGTRCLLIDEDTSATNFMIRDARMQALVGDEHEPITAFIDRVRLLHDQLGVSTVLVIGGSGDYFDVADRVIAMVGYRPREVTDAARRIAERRPTDRRPEGAGWTPPRPRIPLPASIDPSRGRRPVSIRVRSVDRVDFGTEEVDLTALEQLVERAQTRAVAEALAWARGAAIDGERDLATALGVVMRTLGQEGLDAFTPYRRGDLAEFRLHELAAFLNRIRGLEVRSG